MQMTPPDDVQYALETTQVLYEPDRRIDTFGATRFEFLLLSELMDTVGQVRVRSGEVEATQPQIIRPEAYTEVDFEGFGEGAQRLMKWMEERGLNTPFLQYGFQFKRGAVTEELVHDSMEEVRGRVVEEARQRGNPMQAVIEGVDDAWEISVLRFTFEMVQKSRGINLFDFQRRGML
jgi:hypothetical protein